MLKLDTLLKTTNDDYIFDEPKDLSIWSSDFSVGSRGGLGYVRFDDGVARYEEEHPVSRELDIEDLRWVLLGSYGIDESREESAVFGLVTHRVPGCQGKYYRVGVFKSATARIENTDMCHLRLLHGRGEVETIELL